MGFHPIGFYDLFDFGKKLFMPAPTYNLHLLQQTNQFAHFQLKRGDSLLSFADVFKLWQQEASFTTFYAATLQHFDYPAFYWEHPALTQKYLPHPYECMVHRSRPLERLVADEKAFSKHFDRKKLVVDFMNLGKDARLVVPTNRAKKETYSHIGQFIRLGAVDQITAVFDRVGRVVLEELEQQTYIWLNTSGLGVVWLHIRMDTRPKYYQTEEYKDRNYLDG